MEKRVLHVLNGLDRGGAQSFVFNTITEMKQKGIVFDFLIRNDGTNEFEELISSVGGRVYFTPPFPQKVFKNFSATKKFFKEYGSAYSAIHVHANSLMYIYPLICAKKAGIEIRIVHCHSSKTRKPLYAPIHYVNRAFLNCYANKFLSCGKKVAKWMFTKQPYSIVTNGIKRENFMFSAQNRDQIRQLFSIDKKATVIGHVGSFNRAKNHKFIINVFHEYLKIDPNAILLLVGVGELLAEIQRQVESLGIKDSVVFAGVREDVYKYYHAMDLFLFPSVFEGLPFALIEAQMSGLPALVSSVISNEVFLTHLICHKSLNDSTLQWANELNQMMKNRIDREKYVPNEALNVYDIKNTCNKLYEIYTSED